MAIIFSCPGCGSKMQAPETLAGQKARCPSCQLVVEVPEKIFEAEEAPPYPPPPRPPGVPPRPPGIPTRPSSPFRDEPETAEGERRPCPMCGEMIMANAVKCRFCGEIFDPALRKRSRSPAANRALGSQMNGVGGLWIFFGCGGLCVAFAGLAAVADRRGPREYDEALVAIIVVVSIVWLVFGVCSCLKQLWAVYAGLVFSYLSLILSLVGLVGAAAGGGASVVGVVINLCLVIAGIVQAHRIISLSGETSRGRGLYD